MPAFAAASTEYAQMPSEQQQQSVTNTENDDDTTTTTTTTTDNYLGLKLITRVYSLPVVSSATNKLNTFYESTKSSNDYVKRTLESVEGSVTKAAAAAKPLILQHVQPNLREFDSFSCRQLDRLEESLPIIKKPTNEILADSRRLVEDAVVQGKSRLDSIRDANEKRVKEAVRTVVDEKVKPSVNLLLNSTETVVERYLQEEQSDDQQQSNQQSEQQQQQQQQQQDQDQSSPTTTTTTPNEQEAEAETYTRVRQLSNKVQRRLYGRAMNQLKTAQLRSQQTLQGYKFTVDLIQYAQDNFDRQAQRLRSSLDATNEVVSASLAKGKASVESLKNANVAGSLDQVRKSVVAASELVRTLSESAVVAVSNPRASASSLKSHLEQQVTPLVSSLQSTVAPYTDSLQATVTPYAQSLQSTVTPYAQSLQSTLSPYAQSLQSKTTELFNLSQPAATQLNKLAQQNIASLTAVYARLQKDLTDIATIIRSTASDISAANPEEAAKNAEAHTEVVRLAHLVSEGITVLRNLTAKFSKSAETTSTTVDTTTTTTTTTTKAESKSESDSTASNLVPADAAGEFTEANERFSEDEEEEQEEEEEEEQQEEQVEEEEEQEEQEEN